MYIFNYYYYIIVKPPPEIIYDENYFLKEATEHLEKKEYFEAAESARKGLYIIPDQEALTEIYLYIL